jgi:hypothetical protein
MKTVIRFTQVNKRTRETRPVWVKSIAWKDGAGTGVRSVAFTTDIREAAPLSLVTAHAVAEQYFNRVVTLDAEDGTPKVEETAKLRQVQRERFARAVESRQAVAAEFNAFLREVADIVGVKVVLR